MLNVAILGATGLVGQSLIEILEERNFPVDTLYLLASHRSAGKSLSFKGKVHTVLDVENFDFSKVQIAFFSAGGAVSKQYAPLAAEKGCIVIDNTSCFRYEKEIPLIIPEVNPEDLKDYKNRNIIANPNCSTIQMLVALKPIHDAVGIASVTVSSYQSVSGAGRSAISELVSQCTELLNGRPIKKPKVLPRQIAFNVIPQIGPFQDNGYTQEEMKMVWETQKILKDDSIEVNATTVRVPVIYGHSESVSIITHKKITVQEVEALLSQAPGVVFEQGTDAYPTPMNDAIGNDGVYVGRIRPDLFNEKGLNLWVVADNIRKGAALNSIQIAEMLLKEITI